MIHRSFWWGHSWPDRAVIAQAANEKVKQIKDERIERRSWITKNHRQNRQMKKQIFHSTLRVEAERERLKLEESFFFLGAGHHLLSGCEQEQQIRQSERRIDEVPLAMFWAAGK